MKFRITEQKVVVAPKANNDVGRSKTYIREAESFEALLIYADECETDENGWIYRDAYFAKQVKEIENNKRVFYTNEDREYWSTRPRSEDGYALDGIRITIQELTEEQALAAINAEQKAKDDKLQKNNDAWYNLLKGLNLEETNQGTLLDELQKYNFPSKIEN